jgi:hypothetical protein
VVSFVITSFYIYVALRRVYGKGGGKTILKSIAVLGMTTASSLILMCGSLVAAIVHVLR